MESNVEPSVRENDASNTTNSEQENETDSEQHGGTKIKRAASHSCESAKDLDTGGNSDNHSGCSEIRASIDVEPNDKHVVRSNKEAQQANR